MPGETGLQLDFSEFNRGVNRALRRFGDQAPQFGRELAEAIIGEAQRRTPVLTGFLVNSATVEPAAEGARRDRVAFDLGFNAKYAAAVHEREELHHSQGGAKYLERAIVEEGERLLAQQVAEFQRRLGT